VRESSLFIYVGLVVAMLGWVGLKVPVIGLHSVLHYIG
jgi:hypothetical protein